VGITARSPGLPQDRLVTKFSDVIDLEGLILRLAGVFCDNWTTRLVRKGARKRLLYCTVLFDLKWIFWQNNNFNE